MLKEINQLKAKIVKYEKEIEDGVHKIKVLLGSLK